MTQEIDIEKYHQLALQKQKEHRKILANLKKKLPKNLDKIAQEIHDEVFQEIDCTACANCCKTLGPDFKEADITRIAKYFKMKLPAFEAEFLAKKLAVMWQDNQDVGKMTGARTKVAGLDAYQLQIVMKSGQYLITWIFQKGEKVYTISFEGDAETLKTFIPYIENTWSLDGTGAVTD